MENLVVNAGGAEKPEAGEKTTEETKMQSDYWNDFTRTGKVSDYLKYVNSAGNTADASGEYPAKNNQSNSMESVRYAGKSDGDGIVGHTGW